MREREEKKKEKKREKKKRRAGDFSKLTSSSILKIIRRLNRHHLGKLKLKEISQRPLHQVPGRFMQEPEHRHPASLRSSTGDISKPRSSNTGSIRTRDSEFYQSKMLMIKVVAARAKVIVP